jgi:hypothetical protein
MDKYMQLFIGESREHIETLAASLSAAGEVVQTITGAAGI